MLNIQALNESVSQANGNSERPHPMVGMYAVASAIQSNIPALERYCTEGLTGLSSSVETLSQNIASDWLQILTLGSNSDQAQMNAETNSSDDPGTKSAKLSALNAQYQMHNSAYNEVTGALQTQNTVINNNVGSVQDTVSVTVSLVGSGLTAQMETATQITAHAGRRK